MKSLLKIFFALLFMVAVNSCADSFAEVQEEMIDEKSDTVGVSIGHAEDPPE